jgi:hypothetical protein
MCTDEFGDSHAGAEFWTRSVDTAAASSCTSWAAGDPTGQSTVVEGVIYAIRPVGIDDAVVVT